MKYCLNPYVRVRFETRIRNGTAFFFNVVSGQIKTSDEVGYEIISIVRQEVDFDTIKRETKNNKLTKNITDDDLLFFLNKLVSDSFVDKIED